MYVAGDRRGLYLWTVWICKSDRAGSPIRSGDTEPPRGALVGEARRRAVVDQQAVGNRHEPIGEAGRRSRRRSAGQDGESLAGRERRGQAANGRRRGVVEAGVDLPDGERLGLADERARDREPRLIDRAECGSEFDLTAAEPDALKRAPRRLALRLARQSEEPLNR